MRAMRSSLRGMKLITVSLQGGEPKGGRQVQRQSSSTPVVTGVGQALIHRGVKAGVLLDEDFAEVPVLVEQDGLQAHQLKKRKEHGDESALRMRVAEQTAQRHRLVFHGEAAR